MHQEAFPVAESPFAERIACLYLILLPFCFGWKSAFCYLGVSFPVEECRDKIDKGMQELSAELLRDNKQMCKREHSSRKEGCMWKRVKITLPWFYIREGRNIYCGRLSRFCCYIPYSNFVVSVSVLTVTVTFLTVIPVYFYVVSECVILNNSLPILFLVYLLWNLSATGKL